MNSPPFGRVALALLMLLLLSLVAAGFYFYFLRPPGLPLPWEL